MDSLKQLLLITVKLEWGFEGRLCIGSNVQIADAHLTFHRIIKDSLDLKCNQNKLLILS